MVGVVHDIEADTAIAIPHITHKTTFTGGGKWPSHNSR